MHRHDGTRWKIVSVYSTEQHGRKIYLASSACGWREHWPTFESLCNIWQKTPCEGSNAQLLHMAQSNTLACCLVPHSFHLNPKLWQDRHTLSSIDISLTNLHHSYNSTIIFCKQIRQLRNHKWLFRNRAGYMKTVVGMITHWLGIKLLAVWSLVWMQVSIRQRIRKCSV